MLTGQVGRIQPVEVLRERQAPVIWIVLDRQREVGWAHQVGRAPGQRELERLRVLAISIIDNREGDTLTCVVGDKRELTIAVGRVVSHVRATTGQSVIDRQGSRRVWRRQRNIDCDRTGRLSYTIRCRREVSIRHLRGIHLDGCREAVVRSFRAVAEVAQAEDDSLFGLGYDVIADREREGLRRNADGEVERLCCVGIVVDVRRRPACQDHVHSTGLVIRPAEDHRAGDRTRVLGKGVRGWGERYRWRKEGRCPSRDIDVIYRRIRVTPTSQNTELRVGGHRRMVEITIRGNLRAIQIEVPCLGCVVAVYREACPRMLDDRCCCRHHRCAVVDDDITGRIHEEGECRPRRRVRRGIVTKYRLNIEIGPDIALRAAELMERPPGG